MARTVGAFTLIELLVVVTIIVVLLALLTPALDRAIYQAQMVQCAATLSMVGRSADVYAVGFQRSYPWRANVHGRGWKPNVIQVATDASSDERPVIRQALGSLNKSLNDPFLDAVDFEGSSLNSNIEVSYNLWFGFGYRGQRGLYRLGDRIAWDGVRYPWIATDIDVIHAEGQSPSFLTSHPDEEGKLTMRVMQDEGALGGVSVGPAAWTQYTLARWELTDGVSVRGTVDHHFGATDGSVTRLDRIRPGDDDRMARLPCTADPAAFPAADQYVPR